MFLRSHQVFEQKHRVFEKGCRYLTLNRCKYSKNIQILTFFNNQIV